MLTRLKWSYFCQVKTGPGCCSIVSYRRHITDPTNATWSAKPGAPSAVTEAPGLQPDAKRRVLTVNGDMGTYVFARDAECSSSSALVALSARRIGVRSCSGRPSSRNTRSSCFATRHRRSSRRCSRAIARRRRTDSPLRSRRLVSPSPSTGPMGWRPPNDGFRPSLMVAVL